MDKQIKTTKKTLPVKDKEPKKKRIKIKGEYWGEEQENAVYDYINQEDDVKRNITYNTFLRDPLDKMVVAIINRYKLYSKEFHVEDLHHDALSDLVTKMKKYDSNRLNDKGKKTKAYSYYGTIIRRYLTNFLSKNSKSKKKLLFAEDISYDIGSDENYSYNIDDRLHEKENYIDYMVFSLEEHIVNNSQSYSEKCIGKALVEIIKSSSLELDEKKEEFNFSLVKKNAILKLLKKETGLSNKDIIKSMNKLILIYRENK